MRFYEILDLLLRRRIIQMDQMELVHELHQVFNDVEVSYGKNKYDVRK